MRTEIGSEFWDIPFTPDENDCFPPNTVWYLSGRTALAAVLKDICAKYTVHTVALPSWCCHTMIQPFVDAGLTVSFYPVFAEHGVLRQELGDCPPCDVTLVMDYFGYCRTHVVPHNSIAIYDATHSIFSGIPKNGDYVFGSLRKWAGFRTGGFAYPSAGAPLSDAENIRAERYTALRGQAMDAKAAYFTGKTAEKSHLALFAAAEAMLDDGASGSAAAGDITAARHLNEAELRKKRRENAAALLEYVGKWAIFSNLQSGDCPLFVPICVPENRRDALRRALISREIYCPVHWPVSALHRLDAQTRTIYETELSLVCDQRYGTSEMRRIGQAVCTFLKGDRII